MTITFKKALNTIIKGNLTSNFDDNYDHYRFGPENYPVNAGVLEKIGLRRLSQKIMSRYQNASSILNPHKDIADKFEYLYSLLGDEISKDLLVKILAFRILGYKKIKLPTNNAQFWETTSYLEKIADKQNIIEMDFMNWKLYLFDLAQIGYPLKLFSTVRGVYNGFIAKQYEYISANLMIKVEDADTVIDAGGGWGDTALRFAYHAGRNGMVYSFDIVPANVKIMERNLELNPKLENRIEIVQKALWNESGRPVQVNVNGPASKVNLEHNCQDGINIKTVSIDDFVAENKLPKVNFIKMDIEGSELKALKGAERTIREFRPKLAISLYHKPDDFRDIPEFIESLGIGYRYHIGHYTIHAEETVLFAITGSK